MHCNNVFEARVRLDNKTRVIEMIQTQELFLTTCANNSSWQPSMLLQTLLFFGLSSSLGLPSQMVTLPFSEGDAFWWRIALSGIRISLWNAEDSFRVEPIPLLGLRFTRAWEQQHSNVKCEQTIVFSLFKFTINSKLRYAINHLIKLKVMSSCELEVYLSNLQQKTGQWIDQSPNCYKMFYIYMYIYISHILSYHYPLNKTIHCDKPNCNDKNEAQ